MILPSRLQPTRLLAVLLVLFGPFVQARTSAQETDGGPEAENLIDALSGYLVTYDYRNIKAVSLPKLQTHIVRKIEETDEGMGPGVHALSGPDDEGRIAYIEDWFFLKEESERRHLLKTVQINGKNDREVFSRAGSAMWASNGEIGEHVCLAPTGGHVAFLSKIVGKQMPRAYLGVGQIEIWNLQTGTGRDSQITALDEPMSWFPDGKRIAYTRLVPRSDLPNSAKGLDFFGTYFGESWDEVPAIYIHKLDKPDDEFLCVGWRAMPCVDGKTFLVGGWGDTGYSWRRVETDRRKSSPLILPGGAEDIVGVADDDVVFYVGWPTTGANVNVLSVKAVQGDERRFQTVLPVFDPGSKASYGPVPRLR